MCAGLFMFGMVRIFERDLAAIKITTAGWLPNDLMSNSLRESWERVRNVACRRIFCEYCRNNI